MRIPRIVLALSMALLAYIAKGEPPKPLHGEVRDGDGPCPGARVRIKGTKHLAESDKRGRFTLEGEGKRVTAWKEGHFIAGAAVGDEPLTLKLRKLPAEDNPDYAWVDPVPNKDHPHNCGNCHGEIEKEWAGSAHGRSGTNKRFLNLYDGTDWHGKKDKSWNLLKEHPDGAAVCAACHAPSVTADLNGFEDFRKIVGVHLRGVHCDYCHKIADAPIKRLGLEHGRFAYKLLRPKQGQLFFGPLDDVDRDEDVYAPLYSQSQYCASCHEGTVFGVKVYTTYSEWLESPAKKNGQQCQTCHMKPTGAMENIAPGRGGIKRDPQTLASHAMPGGSPEMLKRCLRLKVRLFNEDETLQVDIETLATDVGHRVPTGFIDRHVILVVEALNEKGERIAPKKGPALIAAVGEGDPAKGNFAGLPGRFFGRLLADENKHSPIPFWRPPSAESDTRLTPDKPDHAAWSFPSAEVKDIRVRLIYRRFFKEVANAKSWPDNEVVVIDEKLPRPDPHKAKEWKLVGK